jgi:hypothetical protein
MQRSSRRSTGAYHDRRSRISAGTHERFIGCFSESALFKVAWRRRHTGMVFQQFNLFRQTRVLISGANAWGSEPFSLAIIFLGAPPDGGCDSRAGGLSLGTSDGLSRVGYSLAA